MPDDYLDGLRAEDRAAGWDGAPWACSVPGPPCWSPSRPARWSGSPNVGPAQDPEGAGELYAINVDPGHWGTGAGRALLGAAQAELARLGFDETVLWVLPANARARRFYEIAGWVADGAERTAEVQGVVVPEVRYRRRSTSEEISSATPVGTE